jgi:SAM-dependent methyltransferase
MRTATAYDLECVSQCVLCGDASARPLFKIPPYGYEACRACGLTRLSPRVAQRELGRLYEDVNRQYQENPTPIEVQLANPTFAWRARRLAAYAGGRRFLEVGCGDGNFLAVLRARGWSVAGNDVGAVAGQTTLSRHGIEIETVSFEDFRLTGSFDAVGLYHVLEHLYEPRGVLREIRRALAPGGILHLQVPNIRSLDGRLGRQLWHGLSCPKHVYLYEPGHLHRLLGQEGLTIASLETYDPFHGPGTVQGTIGQAVKAAVRSLRAAGAPDRVGQPDPADGPTGRSAASAPPFLGNRRVVGRAVAAGSLALARGQALLGFGNVADVVAVAT